MKKVIEEVEDLHIAFIDVVKFFDRVNWKKMVDVGITGKRDSREGKANYI